jgi:hypothetical protein
VLTKNQKKLLEKVEAFKKWLESQTNINVHFIDMDDGLAVLTHK